MHDFGEVCRAKCCGKRCNRRTNLQLIDATTNVDRYNQISEHRSDFNFFKAYIIRIYAQLTLISQSKIERKDIDDEIVDRLSTAVQNSVESGIFKSYNEVAKGFNIQY